MRLRVISVALAAAVALAACVASGAQAQPNRVWNAEGILVPFTDGDPNPGEDPSVGSFRLSVDQDGEYGYFWNASLLMDDATPIVGDGNRSLSLSDLEAGMVVQVWADVCMESYPVQCHVQFLKVVSGEETS